MDDVATQLRSAFNARDIDTFRGLLAEDAIWGDDPGQGSYCHSRNDIVAHLKRLLGEGVNATMVEATMGPRGVACVLEVEWPQRETWRPQHQSVYQTYLVANGKITEIHGHDDQASALAAIS